MQTFNEYVARVTDYRNVLEVLRFQIVYWDNTKHPPECQTPHYNKHLHQISLRCISHYTIGHHGQLHTHYHQTTYLSSPQLTYDNTTDYNKTDRHSPTTSKLTEHNSQKTHSLLSLRPPYPPTYTLTTEFSQTSY